MMGVWRHARFAASLAATLLALGREASAEYPRRVVLLEPSAQGDADLEIATRVRAELTAAGFEVIALPAPASDPKQAVEAAGRELHPAAVLLVERLEAGGASPAGTDLWLSDRLLKKTVVLRLRPETAPAGAVDASTLRSREAARVAVQAVELVKARLAELSLTRERKLPPPTPAPPPDKPAPEPRGAHPNLTLALGMLHGFQEGQRALTPVVRLGVTFPEGWTGPVLALDARGSFVGLGQAAHVSAGPGSASWRHTAMGLDAVMRFAPGAHLQPFVTLGGGMLAIDVTGEAPDPYRNDSKRTLSGLLTAGAGLWVKPVASLGLSLEGQLIEAWSKTIVRIAGEDAAEVAAPLVLLNAGLVAEF